MIEREAYPLTWPAWVPRMPSHKITSSQFFVTPDRATKELYAELRRLGASNIVVSSNVAVRRDGRPYARPPKLTDTGVAVYFRRNGTDQCIACDRYREVWENIRAIGLTIERLRGIERYGTSQMVDAAFQGYAVLPETAGGEAWWNVLEVTSDATRANVEAAYRALARQHHPDAGGDPERFRVISEAYRQAVEAVSS